MKLGSLSLRSIAKWVGTVAIAGAAASASAGPMGIFVNDGWQTAASGDGVVGPGAGGQAFDAEYLFYKQIGNSLWLGLQSGFNLTSGSQVYNGKTYYAGDLALSFDGIVTNGDASTFEYGVDFGLLTKSYGSNNTNDLGENPIDTGSGTGIDAGGGLYVVNGWNQNNQIYFQTSNPFAIDTGIKVKDLLTNIAYTEGTSFARIVSFDLTGLGLGDQLAMHWTMSCGNDSIVGGGQITKVPEPGTLSMLGIGLLGLALLRRRRTADQAR